METTVLLLDFDGVYRAQDFYRGEKCRWIHADAMTGVSGYCDSCAQKLLRQRLEPMEQPALSFLGSGNYHYITLFLTEKIREDFALVLFDHHNDMQKPAFGRLLSCGNWLRRAAERLVHLKQIVLVGTDKPEADNWPNIKKIMACPGRTVGTKNWCARLGKAIRYPVYLSVDKDVFSKEVARTNWDQGTMRMQQFSEAFWAVSERQPIIGMDICGEFPALYGEPLGFQAVNRKNDRANRKLLELWKGLCKFKDRSA